MIMAGKMALGKKGEDAALEWFQREGYVLLDRNWRNEHKEIDLIMESEKFVHIIEVKTLKAPVQRQPYEAVDPRKQRLLASAAAAYVGLHHIRKEVLFDVMSVIYDGDEPQFEYLPQAFIPIY
jgi:Predicted endonuclease distantly related to archaeal Holliday junction resolvase